MKKPWNRVLLSCYALCVILGSVTLLADDDDHHDHEVDRSKLIALVKAFAPADIIAQSNKDPQAMPLHVDAVAGNLDGGGAVIHVIAVYGNGVNGRVRLFKLDAGGPTLIAEPNVPGMAGLVPSVQLLDIDGDNKPEVIVTFADVGSRSEVWVLKWNGTQLTSITPVATTSGGPVSLLTNAIFEDLDGAGKLAAITAADPAGELGDKSLDSVMRRRTYKLSNGQFVQSSEMFYARRFYGKESPQTATFVLGRLDVQYRLRISNGDSSGKNLVKNGEIVLNDATLISQGDFDSHTRVLSKTFQPMGTNVLHVTIRGENKDTLFIAVEPVVPIVDKPVTPAVECVWDDGGGRFTASFSYTNPNPWSITIAAGTGNTFSSDTPYRGQSKIFFPGRNQNVFWVQSNGEALAWTVGGTTATATLDIPRCTASEPAQRTF
jgi:hypothetical protein